MHVPGHARPRWRDEYGYGWSIGGYVFGHFEEIEKIEPIQQEKVEYIHFNSI